MSSPQVAGRKRVRLWPPAAHECLHVFPDAHPRARKAQLDVDDPAAGGYALGAGLDAPALDVVLEPGDAVAIPAFWFHHCEALDLSCSLNAFFPSRTAALAAEVLAAPRPDGADLRTELGPDLARRVYASRYAPLAAAYGALDAGPPPPPPPGAPPDAARRARDAAVAALAARDAGVVDVVLAHLLEAWAMGLAGDAARVGDLLRDPGR